MSAEIEMMSLDQVQDFNASVYVSEQLNRQLINMSQDLAYRCVGALADHYNFDADEACRLLGLAMMKVERKAPIEAKTSKAPKVSVPKAAFPLPYNGEFNDSCCYALRQNNGLYTQCTGVRKGEAQFCKGCATLMQKTGAEVPEYGTIQQRMAVDILDYVDPKGRKPIAYTKVMKKYKINKEQLLEEAGKLNIIINPNHFVVPEETKRGRPKAAKEPKAKGAKGRPKKEKKVLMIEGNDYDLFESLLAEANEDADEEMVIAPNSKKAGKSDEEKAKEREAERLAKEAKRLAEKAENEAKLAAEKAEKEAKKEAERLAREAKKAEEEDAKKQKEEQRLKEKAEKEAKLAAEKAAKEAAKSQKSKKPAAAPEPEEDEEPDVVKRIDFEGKRYLKSKERGIIYDYNEYLQNGQQVVVGKWVENKIVFESAEEEEEEYDM